MIPAERYIIDAFQIIVKHLLCLQETYRRIDCVPGRISFKKNLILIAVTEHTVLYKFHIYNIIQYFHTSQCTDHNKQPP